MNKKAIIILVVALIGIFLLVMLFNRPSPDKKKFIWSERYRINEKQPYDLHVIGKLVKSHFSGDFTKIKDNIHKYLNDDVQVPSNYIMIGGNLHWSDSDYDTIIDFVGNGNNAFISSRSIPASLLSKITNNDNFNKYRWKNLPYYSDSIVTFKLYKKNLDTINPKYEYVYKNEVAIREWRYFDEYQLDSLFAYVKLGCFEDDYINLIKIPYKKGCFYFHTNPLAFTNFHMIDENKFKYASKVFSYLDDGDIYWDDYSRIPFGGNSFNPDLSKFIPKNKINESPLNFLLSHLSLRWAWYIILSMVALYMIFRAKRKQAIIPVLEKNVNTSLEFINTIGRLYFLQNDHKKLAVLKRKHFLSFIRNRYGLPTNTLDENLIKKISQKSEIHYDTIETIFKYFRYFEKDEEVDDYMLTHFNSTIEMFYNNCK